MAPGAWATAGAVIAHALLLVACSQDENAHKKAVAEEPSSPAEVAELELDHGEMFSIDALDNAELERRLRGHVSARDGLLVPHGPFRDQRDTYVLPADSPWVISCGFGVTVYFGSAVTGNDGETDNVVTLDLFWGHVPREICDAVGPALGEALRAMPTAP
jgi:hypothetical protein